MISISSHLLDKKDDKNFSTTLQFIIFKINTQILDQIFLETKTNSLYIFYNLAYSYYP